jgi:hypothetical protein
MGEFQYGTDRAKAFREISMALFDLRDSLLQLSITIKDWQFATDTDQRQKSEAIVQELMQKLGAMR